VRRTRFDDWDCSIARTVDMLGDWWTPMVIRSAFLGARRFDDFQAALGIPRNVLTERLRGLVDQGVLRREQYSDRPARYEYKLTEKGVALYPVIISMMKWGDEWLDWPDGPPIHLVDKESGERIDPVLVDRNTGRPIDPRRTRVATAASGRGVSRARSAPALDPAP
jgi:DNA-binding HxlR family transcriptional regulator